LLVGGLIVSALPPSDFEDEPVGDTSLAAKRQVQAAASKGFDTAKSAIGGIYDETSGQAEAAEGLTTEGIGKAAQDISQRVRRVAEAAVTTAFEPLDENHQPKTRDHRIKCGDFRCRSLKSNGSFQGSAIGAGAIGGAGTAAVLPGTEIKADYLGETSDTVRAKVYRRTN
jgi:hypothetical protein